MSGPDTSLSLKLCLRMGNQGLVGLESRRGAVPVEQDGEESAAYGMGNRFHRVLWHREVAPSSVGPLSDGDGCGVGFPAAGG